MIRGRLASAVLAGFVFLAPLAARAQQAGDAERKAAAQALFDEARQLTADGKYPEACPKFVESLRLDASIGTKFYLADCFEHTGKLASAWTYYLEVADAAKARDQKDREKYASERAEALKQRLSRLSIKVPDEVRRGASGIEIKRDGVVVGEAQWGVAIPVDAGTHVVEVTGKDKKPARIKVEATREGEAVEVSVPMLEALPPPAPPKVEAPPAPPPAPPSPPPPSRGQLIAGIVVAATGVVVGAAVGGYFGAQAISKKNESNSSGHCNAASDACDGVGLGMRSDALSAANASNGSIVAGGLVLAGGIVLMATAPKATTAVPHVAVGWRW